MSQSSVLLPTNSENTTKTKTIHTLRSVAHCFPACTPAVLAQAGLQATIFKKATHEFFLMNFQGLAKVETYQTYLDVAFRNGVAKAMQVRQKRIKDRLTKSKHIERARMETVAKSLINSLDGIIQRFPRTEELAPFYHELLKCTLDEGLFKQSLGALNWAARQINSLHIKHKRDLARQRRFEHISKLRRAFSGRISSVMKQIKNNLRYLDECRKIMKSYPAMKTKVNTIVIAGAPNVGKSTLLAVLTSSKPKTAYYPFTTKRLNLGYDAKKNQYVDTPGLLDRPLAERNKIERQAILALKHLATLIIFVIDPTETCGYTIPEQRRLLVELKKTFSQPFIVVSNKADTGVIFKNSIEVSATEGIGIAELRKEINAVLEKTST